jgi:hypothetical protein
MGGALKLAIIMPMSATQRLLKAVRMIATKNLPIIQRLTLKKFETTKNGINSICCIAKLLFTLPEITVHKQQLVVNCVCPISPVVSTGPGDIIVRYVSIHQLLMKVLIYSKKEIFGTTINY